MKRTYRIVLKTSGPHATNMTEVTSSLSVRQFMDAVRGSVNGGDWLEARSLEYGLPVLVYGPSIVAVVTLS